MLPKNTGLPLIIGSEVCQLLFLIPTFFPPETEQKRASSRNLDATFYLGYGRKAIEGLFLITTFSPRIRSIAPSVQIPEFAFYKPCKGVKILAALLNLNSPLLGTSLLRPLN